MSGPTPRPNEISRKLGNPGKKKMTKAADIIQLQPISDGIPPQLNLAGMALWIQLKERTTWIAESDRTALIVLCERYDRRAEMIAELGTNYVLETDKGYKYPNPLVGMLSTLEQEIVKMFSLMGLTPADRTRLALGEVTTQSKLQHLRNQKAAK